MKNPDTFVLLDSAFEPESLDPSFSYETDGSGIIFNVYETLVGMKKDKFDEFVPLLATKWDISGDGKTYTFTIRKGVKFHEGQDLTPEDVAYSFWRGIIQDRAGGPGWIMLQPLFGLNVYSFKGDIVDGEHKGDWVAACEAAKKKVTFDNNAGTVTLNLAQAYGPMLQVLVGNWGATMSKSWVAGLGGWNGDCATAEKYHDPKAEDSELFKAMNGTGPYKLESWAPGEDITLLRNDNYWVKEPLWEGGPTGPARIERVTIKSVKEWGTRFAMFKQADGDAAVIPRQFSTQVDPYVKEECDFKTFECTTVNPNGFLRLYKGMQSNSGSGWGLNQTINVEGGNAKVGSGQLDGKGIPPDFFADIHVRKAFSYCYDADTVIKEVFRGEGKQRLGPIIEGHLGFKADQARYSFNLDQCAAEFKASTHKSADGKSLWDTGFFMQHPYTTGNDSARTEAQILKDSLEKVNSKFKVELVEQTWPSILKETDEKRLPITVAGWIEDFHDPHNWAQPYMSSAGYFSAAINIPEELQKQLDDLVLKGVQTTDQAERAKIYGEMQDLSYENALYVWTASALGRRYEPTWIHGWYFNPAYWSTYYYALEKKE
jgi:peptide/nickel transport system substrate-binding protein